MRRRDFMKWVTGVGLVPTAVFRPPEDVVDVIAQLEPVDSPLVAMSKRPRFYISKQGERLLREWADELKADARRELL